MNAAGTMNLFFTHISDYGSQAFFVYGAHGGGREAQRDEAIFLSEKKALFFQVGLEASIGDSSDL
jgi:hypothetical protein